MNIKLTKAIIQVLSEQIITVLPYIHMYTVIQVYNILKDDRPDLCIPILVRVEELLAVPKKENVKNSFTL